jgi:hypothetical protein
MNKHLLVKSLLWAFVLILLENSSTAGVDLSGYFENRFFLIESEDISWSDLKNKFDLGDYNRLRLKIKAAPSKKVIANVAVDFFSFYGALKSPLGIHSDGDAPGQGGGERLTIDLDRAYVDLYFKKFDISVGKQRAAMGVSYLWAPLDIFNRVNILEPKEEKPGTNALKIYVPLGKSSSLTGVFAPEDNFKTSKSGLRAKIQVAGIDMAATYIRWNSRETTVYGLDLRGENFIGWWLEAGYFASPRENEKKIVLGFDYTFPVDRGLYWLNEFYYDSSGETDSSKYEPERLASGERFTLWQTYFFSMLRYSFSEFLSASLTYIGNWGDGSYILNPTLQYEISQSILVLSGFYFPLGDTNGEFHSSNRNIFFIWLKVNF